MTTPLNGSPVAFAGVVTVPQASVHLDIQKHVRNELAGLPDGKTMAVLNVKVKTGLNLAVAHKFNDQWDVVAWVGKTGWQQPLTTDWDGGVSLSFSR